MKLKVRNYHNTLEEALAADFLKFSIDAKFFSHIDLPPRDYCIVTVNEINELTEWPCSDDGGIISKTYEVQK